MCSGNLRLEATLDKEVASQLLSLVNVMYLGEQTASVKVYPG